MVMSARVIDVNDMPPKFSNKEWFVDVDELDITNNSEEYSTNTQTPILIVTVTDYDLFESNTFVFKILNDNINAERFSLHANKDSASASLRVVKSLDYENPNQRNIVLDIAVCDNGGNFSDQYHTDYGLIHVRLRDVNDNAPQFLKSSIEVSVAEDTPIGTIVAKFHATDADKDGYSRVSYSISRDSDRSRLFSIDSNGIVRLERDLDRESVSKHKIVVIVSDNGNLPKSARAKLTVDVKDVNDNAPDLYNNYFIVIKENSLPQNF